MIELDALVIHPVTKTALAKLQTNLPQSLLLCGPSGIGLKTIAQAIGGRAVAVELQPQNAKGELDESGTISVEMVRRLYEQTRSKQNSRQLVIIDDADKMSHGAQSAFLKLLEEPGVHTTFILTSHAPDRLLTTIRSRVQRLDLRPVTVDQTKELIRSLGEADSIKTTQLLYLASGLPAEVVRLLGDGATFMSRAAIIGDARIFLQGTTYEKSLVAQKYRNDRAGALQLIDSATAMLRRTLSAKPQQAIVSQLELLLGIRENITSNFNITLQLMRFVL